MKAVFISRHALSESQHTLLAKAGFVGEDMQDFDAFASEAELKQLVQILHDADAKMVITVHQLLALRLSSEFLVGTFNNVNRAKIGEKPDFETTQLVIVDNVPRLGAWDLVYNHDMTVVDNQ
jgi:hypothetical protein